MLKKVIPTAAMLCIASVPTLTLAAQPLGCGAPVTAAITAPSGVQPSVQYRSYSYDSGTAVGGYRVYSMPRGKVQQRSYENAVNKSLGRVN